jgi:DNA-binding winged helix-turn-helix (wHTH) protein/predicted ATPase
MLVAVDDHRIFFDPFWLDRSNECLLRGSEVIKLRPKAYAVLNHLIRHNGQLVTKEDLLATVWPGTFVTDAVLKVTIQQLRDVLEDDSKAPRFIETAHRRGYRFIGQIAGNGHVAPPPEQPFAEAPVSRAEYEHYPPLGIVGRDEALSRMRRLLTKMLGGERQIVFVTGEAGIGKTALADTFARYIGFDRSIRLGRGQCLEQYGTGEAYLPILEAIGRLCREDEQVIEVLRAHAPMWLLQMPSLLSAKEREALSREVVGASRERMLREVGQALEALASDRPLVLILEDLHWSDYSTLDLISYIATQRQPAQLMLIGTYRTVELIVSGHPLNAVKQELLAKQQCEEMPLAYLSADAIAKYLSVRFPRNRFPEGLAGLIHERTEGNPLFMVNAVDYLITEKLVVKTEDAWELVAGIEQVDVGVPDSIKQMIHKQIDNLDEEAQRILEAASLAGSEFSVLAVVAALDMDRSVVESRCEQLARQRRFLQDGGVHVLPNGEAAGRYAFIHALYQNVLYDRVSTSRRVQFHRRIAERGEEIWGERAKTIAAELAMHFERGRDYRRAAKYLQQAADNDIRRFAYHEAVVLAKRGLDLLTRLPESDERAASELCLQLTLGVPLIATAGYAAEDVGRVYRRARELCRESGEPRDVAEALWGLWTFHILKADLGTAREIAEEFLSWAKQLPNPSFVMRGHSMMELISMHSGQFPAVLEHFTQALLRYYPEQHVDDAFLYALNPGVAMPCFAAWTYWFMGQPDEAVAWVQKALTLAQELSEPHSLSHVLLFAAVLHQLRGDVTAAQAHADAAIASSSKHGLAMYHAMATIMKGWTLVEQQQPEEAVEQIQTGLAALEATGTELVRPHFLALLAEALKEAGRRDDALRALEQALALAQQTGEVYYEAELYRLKGELQTAETDAEACFAESLKIAHRHGAKSWELRTVMSVARLRAKQGKKKEGRAVLARVHNSFTEGFDTADLREARALLETLS